MKYQRKTVDYYKMEIFSNRKWETILDTDNVYEYRKLLNELYLKPIKHKGKKYRRVVEDLEMKNGTHGSNSKQIDELTAYKLLKELYENRKNNEDGKVHVHEIQDGHIGKEIERF